MKAQRAAGGGWASPWLILITLITGLLFSALIPPMQSPDEHDHIRRAYLLGKGTIVLNTPTGMPSGGMIDSGLAAYIAAHWDLGIKPDRKLSAEEVDAARGIRWSGKREFNAAPGTGYYFPLIYLPQTVGLAAGELLGMTVEKSYYLARMMALLSVALLLFAAFSLYTTTPLVIALLVIPMSVFQFSSASLDGVSTALAILAIASFMRLSELSGGRQQRYLFYLLVVLVVLLSTSRVHLLPLFGLVLVACLQLKGRLVFTVSAVALIAVVLWLAIAIGTTVDTRRPVGIPTSSVLLFYLTHPWRFVTVMAASLSPDYLAIYRDTFVGVLGWLNTRFSQHVYFWLSTCLTIVGLLSVSTRRPAGGRLPQMTLLLAALASFFLVFLALLITWNRHPAASIDGIQGRYFLIPAIMIAYVLNGPLKLYEGVARKFALVLVGFIGMFTAFQMPMLLIDRYYLMAEQPPPDPVRMRPSPMLDVSRLIRLLMGDADAGKQGPLEQIGIMFGTYARNNAGSAELRMFTSDGQVTSVTIELSELPDNRYTYFPVDAMAYSAGEIVYRTGGGISTWEVHRSGEAATCLIRQYRDGSRTVTRGCPRP